MLELPVVAHLCGKIILRNHSSAKYKSICGQVILGTRTIQTALGSIAPNCLQYKHMFEGEDAQFMARVAAKCSLM